jgi:D-glycerate 3-kinase
MLQILLAKILAGEQLQRDEWQGLCHLLLQDDRRAAAFKITPATVEAKLQQRVHLLQMAYPVLAAERDRLFPSNQTAAETADFAYLKTLWDLWLPMALDLAERRRAKAKPLVQGILGGQGAGKTTLGKVLTLLLAQLGYRTLSWSLDDLYKTYADRLQLQQADPRLIWRGPPGTHDVQMGIDGFDQLQTEATQPIAIARFDKSLHQGMGDRAAPELVTTIDIVLFEGWFVGVQPIDPAMFDHAPPPIVTESDRAFARDTNTRLWDYLPLWERLDSLWVLYLPDYRLSKQWRKQAEHDMKAIGKPGMSDAEVEAFVDYFWQALHPELFITPALHHADLIVEINPDHSPGNTFTLKPQINHN